MVYLRVRSSLFSQLLIALSAVQLCWATIAATPPVPLPSSDINGIRVATYSGWPDCLTMTAGGQPVRVVCAPAIGGRIIHYGWDGQNLLLENPRAGGKTLAAVGADFLPGGSWTEIWGGESVEATRLPTVLGPWKWSSPEDTHIEMESTVSAESGLKLEREVVLDPETGDLGMTTLLWNLSDKPRHLGLWHPTACRGPGYLLVPVAGKTRFPLRWARAESVGPDARLDPQTSPSPWIKVLNGVLVAKAGAEAIRFAVDTPSRWFAFTRGKTLLVLHLPTANPVNQQPITACLYVDQQMAEIAPVTPKQVVASGAKVMVPMRWTVIPLRKEVSSFEEARGLAARIKRDPDPTF